MPYLVVESPDITRLMERVNAYEEQHWFPLGGMTAIRERVSGPIIYFQAIAKEPEEEVLTSHNGRGRGRPKKKKHD